jgi:Ca2+-binding EF-hand superfamily protein
MEVIRRTAANASAYKLDLKKVFRDFDVSGDGFLSIQEMAGAFLHMGVKLDSDTLTAMFRHFDPNDSGSVHFGEFQWGFFNRRTMARQWKRRTEGLSDDQLRSMFHDFDKNGDGRLNRKEFKKLLVHFGVIMSDDDQDVLTRRFDEDGDGDVNMHEFFNFIQEELKLLHLHPQHEKEEQPKWQKTSVGDDMYRNSSERRPTRSSASRRNHKIRDSSPRGSSGRQSYKTTGSNSPSRSKSPSRRDGRSLKNGSRRRHIIGDNDDYNDNDNEKVVNVDDDYYERRGLEDDRNMDSPPYYHDREDEGNNNDNESLQKVGGSERVNGETEEKAVNEDEEGGGDKKRGYGVEEKEDYKRGIAERNSEGLNSGAHSAHGSRNVIRNEEISDDYDQSDDNDDGGRDTSDINHDGGRETLWATNMLRAQAHIESRLGNRYYY